MFRKLLLGVTALLLAIAPLQAQTSRGFVPDSAATTTIACSNVNATASLPGTGPIVAVQNAGQSEVFVALGASTVVAAVPSGGTATNGTPILPGTAAFLSAIPPQPSTIACITSAGTTNIRVTTGAGSPVALAGVNSSTAAPAAGTAGAGYPPGATPVSNAATGTTAGTTATLPAAAGKFTYICGFSVSPGSATTAITINIVMTAASTFTLAVGAPVTAVGTTGLNQTQTFSPCVPGSAVNTTITVAAGALGTGGVNQDVNAWGFQQ